MGRGLNSTAVTPGHCGDWELHKYVLINRIANHDGIATQLQVFCFFAVGFLKSHLVMGTINVIYKKAVI